ncbi:MAG: alpha/beta fold hydrolase [Nevskia sp.]|nr:alpha/beta fold hydrolase [Nevskia sp.]
MPQAKANGLTLEYETFGRPQAPAILLVMGLGGQLTLWPDSFCQALAEAGYYVIRYDNRDVGLSSKIDEAGRPRLMRAGLAYTFGLPVKAGYTLDDMAQDAIGLLDALAIKHAHVIGTSMGGMIAQILAAKYPKRISSLVSLMSTSGNPRLPGPAWKIRMRLVKRPTTQDRETLILHAMGTWRLICSPDYRPSEQELRASVERGFDRSSHPRGLARQTLAILASGSRLGLLAAIRAPTLIIHGAADRLLPVAAAYELAEHIAGARLEIIPGMGHDLPEPLIPRIVASILRHFATAERPRLRARALSYQPALEANAA